MSDIVRRRGAIGYVEKRVPPRRLVREILIAAALTERLMTSVSAQFSGESSSPRRARTFVRGVLDSADELLLETVELLVSELVTNAVVHASSAPVVDVHVSPETLRIEVYDASATLPRPRAADEGGPGGRGLDLIDRSASRWGADRSGDGKVVWFELDRIDSAR
jgi:anti-sigma regulatory factor (Ser/Thr protein kinase)